MANNQPLMTKGKDGFQFRSSSGKGITAFQYAQQKGVGYRDLLQNLANQGDRNASTVLKYTGNDGVAPLAGSAYNDKGLQGALSALGAKKSVDWNKAAQNVGDTFLNGTAKLANQGLGIIENTAANVTGNKDLIASTKKHVDQNLLAQGKGLFGSGGIYNSTDALHTASPVDVAKRGAGTGAQALTEIVSPVKGAQLLRGGQSLGKRVVQGVATAAPISAISSGGRQLSETGTVNPDQLGMDTAIGGLVGGALPIAGQLARSTAAGTGKAISYKKGAILTDFAKDSPTVNIRDDMFINGGVTKTLNQDKVNAYKRQIMNGDTIEPLVVQKNKDALFKVLDGQHRLAAFKELGIDSGIPTRNLSPGQLRMASQGGYARIPGQEAAKTGLPTPEVPAPKLSRFANRTVQNSDEVSTPLKKLVKEEQSSYIPTTDAARLEIADGFLKGKTNDGAYTDVVKRFENYDNVNDQDIVNAIQTAKKLDGSTDEADLLKATEIYAQLSPLLSKRGQEIQAASLLSNRTPQGLIYQAEKALRNGGIDVSPEVKNQLKSLVDTVKKQKPGSYEDGLSRFKMMQFVDRSIASVPDAKKQLGMLPQRASNLWKAGLLTAPTTTGGNLLGNASEQAYKRIFRDPVANGADIIMSAFTGKRSRSMTTQGLGGGFKEGVVNTAKFFKTGYDQRNPLQKFDAGNIHYSNTPAGKAAEVYTQSVFRLMGAADQPFYYMSFRNSLADQAITAAKNAKLQGKARKDFIEQYTTQPSKQALDIADQEAKYDTFGNKTVLGSIASRIKQGDKTGISDVLIPFSQVPSSVAMRMIDRTPIGLAREIIGQVKSGKFDQRAMTKAIADASGGIVIIGAGAALAKSDLITLGFPSDQTERDLWELEGRQPNSVKIGDKWIGLNYLQPLGSILAAGASYQQAINAGEDPTAAASSSVAGAAKALTDQSFLKGVSGALNAVNDPLRSASTFAESTAGSVVPNLVRSFARSADPVQREQDTPLDAVKAGVPGARESLDVRTDIFGQPVPRKTNGLESFLNPFKPSDVRQKTPVNAELRRLFDNEQGISGAKINKNSLGKDINGTPIELDEKQRRVLGNNVGSKLELAYKELVQNSTYTGLSDEEKKKELESAKEQALKTGKAEYASSLGKEVAVSGGTKVSVSLSGSSKQILKTYDLLDKAGREKLFNNTNDAEYKYKNAKYENDLANGTLSKAEQARAKLDVAKEKVGTSYTKETRDLFGLSKNMLYTVLTTDPKGASLAESILAYDDALTTAGLQTKNKFRDKYGNVALEPSTGSTKGSGGKGGSTNSSAIAAVAAGAEAASSAKVSGSRARFQNKVSARGLQAYKKVSKA